jgi:hypothetical protein
MRAPNPALLFDVLQEDDDSMRQQKLHRASIDIAPGAPAWRSRREASAAAAFGAAASADGTTPRSPGPDAAASAAASSVSGVVSGDVAFPETALMALEAQQRQQEQEHQQHEGVNGTQPHHQQKQQQQQEPQQPPVGGGGGAAPPALRRVDSAESSIGAATPTSAAAADAAAGAGAGEAEAAGVIGGAPQFGMTPAEVLQELLGPLYVDATRLTMGEPPLPPATPRAGALGARPTPSRLRISVVRAVPRRSPQLRPHRARAGRSSPAFPAHEPLRTPDRRRRSPNQTPTAPKITGDLLGQGGFAEVHRATLTDPALPGFEEPVAVKTLRPDVLRSPQELREFLAEANLLRKMMHP